jgi:hypothetical protein
MRSIIQNLPAAIVTAHCKKKKKKKKKKKLDYFKYILKHKEKGAYREPIKKRLVFKSFTLLKMTYQ